MKFDFGGNSMWQLVTQSDFVTKLVLLFLLMMSIMCWAIFLYKYILLQIKQRQMMRALTTLKNVHTFEELRAVASAHSETLPGFFLQKNSSTLKALLEAHPEQPYIKDKEVDMLQMNLDQTVEHIVHNEESYLPVLFICAAASPLLGLFGTVWGLVHAFMRISEKQSADITTVAPGIAEALITTLAGLVVAIPAVMMYHYLHAQVREIEYRLYTLADKFFWITQLLFIK